VTPHLKHQEEVLLQITVAKIDKLAASQQGRQEGSGIGVIGHDVQANIVAGSTSLFENEIVGVNEQTTKRNLKMPISKTTTRTLHLSAPEPYDSRSTTPTARQPRKDES
jgi:hypothetical protein